MINKRLTGSALFLVYSSIAVSSEEIHLEPISIIGHYNNAVGYFDSSSEGEVTSQLIKNRPTLRTGEVLEFVPGVIVSQHSGDGKANQYYLRGFNLDHGTDFATYVDGIPVNMRTHAHGQGYTDLNFLIPELIQSIHYKKGPYYANEGDFSSAGTARLNLMDSLPKGLASLSLGSYDYQRMVLANSFNLGEGHLLYGLELNRNSGPWENDQDLKKYNALLRFSEGNHNNGFNITAMAYDNTWDATDQIPKHAVDSGQIDRFGTLDSSDGGESYRYSLSFSKHRRDEQGVFELKTYAVHSKLDLYSNFTYFLNDPVNGDQFNQYEKRDMFGFDVSQDWFTSWSGMDIENTAGLQARYDDISPISLHNTTRRERISLIREDSVKEASIGLYLENKTQWLEKFRSVAGIRYDWYNFDVNSSMPINSGSTNDDIISPKISLIFGPWAETEIFVNYGHGFHSNDARGTVQKMLPSGTSAIPADPLVKTKGGEVGIRTEVISGLQSSLAIWKLDIDSELVFVGDAGETEASRSSERYGVEWSNHYVANKWVLFNLDIALSKARYSNKAPEGDYIPGSINQVASLGVTVNNLNNWFGAFQLRYFGPRPLLENNSVRSDSTTTAYARVGYDFSQDLSLALDVFNLFDSEVNDIDYFYTSQLSAGSGATDDIHFHPVEPRAARLTLTYNF